MPLFNDTAGCFIWTVLHVCDSIQMLYSTNLVSAAIVQNRKYSLNERKDGSEM